MHKLHAVNPSRLLFAYCIRVDNLLRRHGFKDSALIHIANPVSESTRLGQINTEVGRVDRLVITFTLLFVKKKKKKKHIKTNPLLSFSHSSLRPKEKRFIMQILVL